MQGWTYGMAGLVLEVLLEQVDRYNMLNQKD